MRRYEVNESPYYVRNPYVEKNPFLAAEKLQMEKLTEGISQEEKVQQPEPIRNAEKDRNAEWEAVLPKYQDIRKKLPQPVWENHDSAIACYYKTWEIAFGNLKKITPENGFVKNYIDSAFNGALFMWDSSFITMFGKYGGGIFPFIHTLDNFYAKQHKDGFICREIYEQDGKDYFARHDPVSTGPDILPWAEWENYLFTGDADRIRKVFYPLLAYHLWTKENRTWMDGSYWSSGWSCGMDNLPRLKPGYDHSFSHGHQIWVDTCFQQMLSCRILLQMAEIISLKEEEILKPLEEEYEKLKTITRDRLWDEQTGFCYDLWDTGEFNRLMHLGAYWGLLADAVPKERMERFVAHLDNPAEFKRTNRIPVLAASSPYYKSEHGYWCGSVWAPANYMVLRGLSHAGYHRLATEIADTCHSNIIRSFEKTGTLFENYKPDTFGENDSFRKDFVGWTGLIPVAVLIEYVLGIGFDASCNTITWHITKTDRHGLLNFCCGKEIVVDLICEKRTDRHAKPVISVKSNKEVKVHVFWDGGEETISSEWL